MLGKENRVLYAAVCLSGLGGGDHVALLDYGKRDRVVCWYYENIVRVEYRCSPKYPFSSKEWCGMFQHGLSPDHFCRRFSGCFIGFGCKLVLSRSDCFV